MTLPAERIVIMSPTHAAEPRVPVTAKLSKRFYDVLGEDVANELVEWFNAVDLAYRTDLRELNELNFARFDAKLEQRLAELRAELRVEFRTELQHVRTEVQQVRSELLCWMFGFWVTTLLSIGGLLVAILSSAP
jgi:exonuclease VII large subunit